MSEKKTTGNRNRKFYIENLGCAKNQVDAENMLDALVNAGWEYTQDAGKADLVIVNTCGFIDSAKEESISLFFSLKESMKKSARIVLSGCLAQRYGTDLFESLPEADGIFGNRDLAQIVPFAESVSGKKRGMLIPEYPDSPEKEYCGRSRLFSWPGSAFLKLSEGCNHRCDYCAIPLIRGSLRSRPSSLIIEEAERLIASGIKEICLIAQDLAAYNTDREGDIDFCTLVERLAALDGDFAIRLLYIHPDAFPERLLEVIKNNPKVLPYFDIPMQHADPKVLRGMSRKGDPDIYFDLVSRIREEIPEAVIRTTLMTGFPGEDEEAFENLVAFVKRCRFDWMGSFVYSREEGTPAYGRRNEDEQKKAEKTAAARQKKLSKIQEKITAERLQRFVGGSYDVLIEEVISDDLAIGRIYSQAPEVDGQTVVMGHGMVSGHVYRCGIRKVAGIDLDAVLI